MSNIKNDLLEIVNIINRIIDNIDEVEIPKSRVSKGSKRKTEYLEPTKENLEKYNLDSSKVVINPDGSIDYSGDVDLSEKNLKEIPFKFNKVSGDFDCENNSLTSLKGSPQEVGGSFGCSSNQLTS